MKMKTTDKRMRTFELRPEEQNPQWQSLHSLVPIRLSKFLWLGCLLLCVPLSTIAESVEQWSMYEITLKGPSTGNPFLDVRFAARFAQGYDSIEVPGFYDGDGNYRVR